jgi:hypothetical protein
VPMRAGSFPSLDQATVGQIHITQLFPNPRHISGTQRTNGFWLENNKEERDMEDEGSKIRDLDMGA